MLIPSLQRGGKTYLSVQNLTNTYKERQFRCVDETDKTASFFLSRCYFNSTAFCFPFFNPLQPSHSVLSFDFRVEGNRYVSDGAHQCSARVVKLSAADRLTEMFPLSITRVRGRKIRNERHKEREREEKKIWHQSIKREQSKRGWF